MSRGRRCQSCFPLCVYQLFISSVHPNEYAIELFPSLLSSKLAAREVEQNIPDTNDREQKSLTTGSISPKQKTLHNILSKSNSNRIDGIIYFKATPPPHPIPPPPSISFSSKKTTTKKNTKTEKQNVQNKKTVKFTAWQDWGC